MSSIELHDVKIWKWQARKLCALPARLKFSAYKTIDNEREAQRLQHTMFPSQIYVPSWLLNAKYNSDQFGVMWFHLWTFRQQENPFHGVAFRNMYSWIAKACLCGQLRRHGTVFKWWWAFRWKDGPQRTRGDRAIFWLPLSLLMPDHILLDEIAI